MSVNSIALKQKNSVAPITRDTIGGNHSNQFEEEGDSMKKPDDSINQSSSLFPKTPSVSQSVTIKNERYADISADILDDDEDDELVDGIGDDDDDDVHNL